MSDIRLCERLPALILLVALLLIGFWPRAISDSLNDALHSLYEANAPMTVTEIISSENMRQLTMDLNNE